MDRLQQQGKSWISTVGGDHDFPMLDHRLHQVGAEAIAQVAVISDVEDEKVSLLAGLEGADGIGKVDGGSRVEGGSDDSLGGGQAHVAASQGDSKLHIATPGSAGI